MAEETQDQEHEHDVSVLWGYEHDDKGGLVEVWRCTDAIDRTDPDSGRTLPATCDYSEKKPVAAAKK